MDLAEQFAAIFGVGGWRDLAACKFTDPEFEKFFPTRGASTRVAKAICRDCVVIEECLFDAIYYNEPAGVRGGLAVRERRKIRKDLIARGVELPRMDKTIYVTGKRETEHSDDDE